MMPLEASSVIGSLAGLAQITGEAFGGTAPQSRGKPSRGGSVPQALDHDRFGPYQPEA